MGDNTGVGPGPGPLRHPRPLTAADLHLQLEKEQEAVVCVTGARQPYSKQALTITAPQVNRLTRELSVLRAAQNASVVSNTSSTSASASGTEPGPWGDTTSHSGLGTSHYQPVRHNRTPSNASSRSFAANVASVSTTSLAGLSSPAPVRPTAQPIPITTGSVPLSRQNSTASRRSRTDSPSPAPHSLSGSYHHHHHPDPSHLPGYFNTVRSQSGTTTSTSAAATPLSTTTTTTTSELSPGILPATVRYEETALRRAELEDAKRENEMLRRRVRELERMVRDAAAAKGGGAVLSAADSVVVGAGVVVDGEGEGTGVGDGGRSRAVSNVTERGVGVPEEEVRVGESAASARGRGRGG